MADLGDFSNTHVRVDRASVDFALNVFAHDPRVQVFAHRIPGANKYTIVRRGNIDTNDDFINQTLAAYQSPTNPVSPERLTTLDSFKYNREIHTDLNDSTCIICLDGFEDGNSIIKLDCRHPYHSGCIKKWFTEHNTCPICKAII